MLRKILLSLCFIFLPLLVQAQDSTQASPNDLKELFAIPNASEETARLTPFSANCSMSDNIIECAISIKGRAYIYKNSIRISSQKGTARILPLPRGIRHEDFNGDSYIFKRDLKIKAEVINASKGDVFVISYQGCDEDGICYPPAAQKIECTSKIEGNAESLEDRLTDNNIFKRTENFMLVLLLCLLFGAALDFTPCVLPMVSIYSATIIGSKFVSGRHNLRQNTSYTLGLALAFGLLGLIFANIGVAAHSILQHPAALIIMSLLLLIFAIDCSGLITIKTPNLLNNYMQRSISKQRDGSTLKAFLIGVFSAIVATPCTSAPLAGALIYVITTNSVFKGMIMFIFIGIGMALPIVMVGIFGSRFIARFKDHSKQIRRLFVIPLLIGAYLISAHLLGKYNQIIGAFVYSFCAAYLLGVLLKSKKVSYIILSSFACFSFVYVIAYNSISYNSINENFTVVKKFSDLERYRGKKIMVTVSADWCTNCHVLDQTLYKSPEFEKLTKDITLLRYDLTDPASDDNKELSESLGIVGVPFMALIDEEGHIISSYTGSVSAPRLKRMISDL